ncbi:MAG: hypothetical protein ACJAVY_002111 [Marinoscillum sp.]|jgi:hypothetical protein
MAAIRIIFLIIYLISETYRSTDGAKHSLSDQAF